MAGPFSGRGRTRVFPTATLQQPVRNTCKAVCVCVCVLTDATTTYNVTFNPAHGPITRYRWLSGSNTGASLQAWAPLIQCLQCSMLTQPFNFPLTMWTALLDMKQGTIILWSYGMQPSTCIMWCHPCGQNLVGFLAMSPWRSQAEKESVYVCILESGASRNLYIEGRPRISCRICNNIILTDTVHD